MRFIVFIFSILFLLSCAGIKKEDNSMKNTSVEEHTKITGKIQIYGNEPHTFVGIVDRDGNEYAVYLSSGEDELRRLQGYLIEFTVVFRNDQRVDGSLYLNGGTVEPIAWVLSQ